MSVSFGDDEQILFRHKSSFQAKEGELVVTSARIVWLPAAATDSPSHITWANVAGVKYSPQNDSKGRVMVMVQTVSNDDKKVFSLTGANSVAERGREQERLKGSVMEQNGYSRSST